MKKILALVLVLTMMLVSAFAVAEAAYTYSEYNYDETMFAEIGGEWLALDGLGLMFYLPDIYVPAEIPEALAEVGTIALYGTTDGTGVLNVAYGPALKAADTAAETIEDLAGYYTSVGMSGVDVIVVNGIPMVMAMDEKNDMVSYSVFFADSTQLLLAFSPASDPNNALMAGLTLTTVMLAE